MGIFDIIANGFGDEETNAMGKILKDLPENESIELLRIYEGAWKEAKADHPNIFDFYLNSDFPDGKRRIFSGARGRMMTRIPPPKAADPEINNMRQLVRIIGKAVGYLKYKPRQVLVPENADKFVQLAIYLYKTNRKFYSFLQEREKMWLARIQEDISLTQEDRASLTKIVKVI